MSEKQNNEALVQLSNSMSYMMKEYLRKADFNKMRKGLITAVNANDTYDLIVDDVEYMGIKTLIGKYHLLMQK